MTDEINKLDNFQFLLEWLEREIDPPDGLKEASLLLQCEDGEWCLSWQGELKNEREEVEIFRAPYLWAIALHLTNLFKKHIGDLIKELNESQDES